MRDRVNSSDAAAGAADDFSREVIRAFLVLPEAFYFRDLIGRGGEDPTIAAAAAEFSPVADSKSAHANNDLRLSEAINSCNLVGDVRP